MGVNVTFIQIIRALSTFLEGVKHQLEKMAQIGKGLRL